jgi:hypothetical protein
VGALPIPWDQWLMAATVTNTSMWNQTELETWIRYYVDYHNDVIVFLTDMGASSGGNASSNSSAGGSSANNATGILTGVDPAVLNAFVTFHSDLNALTNQTLFLTPLDFNQIWNSTIMEAGSVAAIVD